MTVPPKVGDVYYDSHYDGLLVVEEIIPHCFVLLEHKYEGSVLCILNGRWPEGLVYVGVLDEK